MSKPSTRSTQFISIPSPPQFTVLPLAGGVDQQHAGLVEFERHAGTALAVLVVVVAISVAGVAGVEHVRRVAGGQRSVDDVVRTDLVVADVEPGDRPVEDLLRRR